jgi:predicted flap endonuclease-1-like 5' DNA nuclease/uncharacterized membrane protein
LDLKNSEDSIRCSKKCWQISGVAGILVALLLMALGGWGFLASVIVGIVIAVAAGFLLTRVYCEARQAPVQAVNRDNDAKTKADDTPAPAKTPPSEAVTAAPSAVAEPKKSPIAKPDTSKPSPTSGKAAGASAAEAKPKPDAKAKAPAASGSGSKPETLSAARESGPDNLKQIKGIGPKLEALLHSMGIYHFDQIASWGADEVAWVDENLQGFKGRVSRDEWVSQAKILAEGGTTEFASRTK